MTKLLVCGGRTFDDAAFVFRILDDLHREHRFREFMQGGARGADALAKEWAMTKGDLKRFEIKANWRKSGPAAGPIRNQQMLDWLPDLVVAFAGGTGTGMVALARAAGVPVICLVLSEQRTLIGCAPSSGNDPFPTSPVSAGSCPPSGRDCRARAFALSASAIAQPSRFYGTCLTCRPRQRPSGAKTRLKLISKRWLSANF
jgi:hypothetical protein